MNSIKELLDMIATDAAEVWGAGQKAGREIPAHELPPIDYNLRLVRYEDGRIEWKE
jgi:hypothetical protein